METNDSIGARLKLERERLRYTQEDLSGIGGVTRQTQSKYEKGLRSPDAQYLQRIAAVGIDAKYVISGSDSITYEIAPDSEHNIDKTTSCEKSDQPSQNRIGDPFPRDETGSNLTTDELQWLEWYRQMSPEDRELVEAMTLRLVEQGKEKLEVG